MRPQKWQQLSVWYWWRIMHGEFQSLDDMLRCVLHEKQSACGVVFERYCSNSCKHCIYTNCENSKQTFSKSFHEIVCNIVSQLPRSNQNIRGTRPTLIHLGREFKTEHLQTMLSCRNMRPDLDINIINNGNYVLYLEQIKKSGFLFDNVEISVEGPKSIHNIQRNDSKAFQVAMGGIKNARKILLPDGAVNALCTLTEINYRHITDLARMLLEENLVDTITFSPITPARRGIEHLEISQEKFKTVWTQLQKVFKLYNTRTKQKVFLQIFRHEDMQKIIHTVGKKKFWEAFNTTPENRNFNGIMALLPNLKKLIFLLKTQHFSIEYIEPCCIFINF